MPKWFPNLSGESFAVQDAMRRIYQRVYTLEDRAAPAAAPQATAAATGLAATAQKSAVLAGYDLLAAGSSSFLRQGQGSLLPIAVAGMTWTATTTTITITWTNLVIYWPDGTQQAVANGSITISGLTNTTVYDFYPYFDLANRAVDFVGRTAPAGVGTPSVAFLASSLAAYQQQNGDGRVALSRGAISATAGGAGGSFGGIGS